MLKLAAEEKRIIMKKINRKPSILLTIGAFIIASAQIATRYTSLTDTYLGLMVGFGIGLMLIAVAFSKVKRT